MTVLELLNNESKWTKGTSARDGYGHRVSPCDPSAVSWCLYGAIDHCYYTDPLEEGRAERALYTALNELFGTLAIAEWQDAPSTTFAMVRQVIERANI